ncbi:MAG: hypothetical protein ACRC2K_13185 [Clostridium sp.]
MVTDTQIIVKEFGKLFNVSFTPSDFKRQLGIAKGLLSKYTKEEILLTINYYSKNRSNEIKSIGYIPYIIDEVLPKAIFERDKDMFNKNLESVKDLTENIQKREISKKKIFKVGNF